MKYLKKFEKTSEYDTFKNSSEWVTPNVSYVVETSKCNFQPYVNDDSVMPIVLNAQFCGVGSTFTTSPSDNPNAKKLYDELMLLSNNTGEGNLDVGLVSIYLTTNYNSEYEELLDVTSYSLAPAHIAEGILLYRRIPYEYYVLQQDGTMKSVFYD